MDSTRTEEPTARRQEHARRQGVVARSPLLATATALLAFAAWVSFAGAASLAQLRRAFQVSFDAVRDGTAPDEALRACAWLGAQALAVPLATIFVVVALVSVAQVGPMFSAGALAPRGGRLGAGLGAMFSPARIGETAWSAFAGVVLFLVGAVVIGRAWPGLLGLGWREPGSAAAAFGTALHALILWMGGVLALVGAADLVLRRLRLRRELRMTRRELVAEQRENQGDPRMRAARRRAHSEVTGDAEADRRARPGRSAGS